MTKTYKVLHAISHEGLRREIGSEIELTADEAKAFGPEYVEEGKTKAKDEKTPADTKKDEKSDTKEEGKTKAK